MPFIAGPYTMVYDGSSIGIVEDVIKITIRPTADLIVGQNRGATPQDGVYRGGTCFIDMVLQEYDSALAKMVFWPYAATPGKIGQVGTLLTSFCKQMIMTAVAGTTASTVPASITFGSLVSQVLSGGVTLAPDYDIGLIYGPRLRNLPIRLQAFPYSLTSVDYWWTQT